MSNFFVFRVFQGYWKDFRVPILYDLNPKFGSVKVQDMGIGDMV